MWRLVQPHALFVYTALGLLLVVLCFLVIAWIRFNQRQQKLLEGAQRHAVGRMMSPTRRAVAFLLLFLATIFTSVSMIGIERLTDVDRPLRETTGIALLLDCSRSILAERDVFDPEEGRLGTVKRVAQSLLQSLDPGYMIALIPFAGDPAPTALTREYGALLPLLDLRNKAIGPHQFTNQGTDIALAIDAGVSMLNLVPELEERIIILISDGEIDNASGAILPLEVRESVQRARQAGYTIFTIAVGTPNPKPGMESKIPDPSSPDGWYHESVGGPIATTVPSPELMREIARQGLNVPEGDPIIDEYFRSSDNPQKLAMDLQSFFARIEVASMRTVPEWRSYDGLLVLCALLFLSGSFIVWQGFSFPRRLKE